jgi:hypothetical protein
MSKIAIYTIAKNEEQFVHRFADSCAAVDGVFVLDTGSTDKTVELLRQRGVVVKQQAIQPFFRFDKARNLSLEMVPEDFDWCISIDLDEILLPDWREKLEPLLQKPGLNRVFYQYGWQCDAQQNVVRQFWYDKVHRRGTHKWVNAVHEVLRPTNGEMSVHTNTLLVKHLPDPAKSRSQYLPLLAVDVAEQPNDERCRLYLGREFYFISEWKHAMHHLEYYLTLPNCSPRERAYARIHLARCHVRLDQPGKAEKQYVAACSESPDTRDCWCELAQWYFNQKQTALQYSAAMRALAIPESKRDWLWCSDNRAWGSWPHDLAAISAYYLGMHCQSVMHAVNALKYEPQNERLKKNLELCKLGMTQVEVSAVVPPWLRPPATHQSEADLRAFFSQSAPASGKVAELDINSGFPCPSWGYDRILFESLPGNTRAQVIHALNEAMSSLQPGGLLIGKHYWYWNTHLAVVQCANGHKLLFTPTGEWAIQKSGERPKGKSLREVFAEEAKQEKKSEQGEDLKKFLSAMPAQREAQWDIDRMIHLIYPSARPEKVRDMVDLWKWRASHKTNHIRTHVAVNSPADVAKLRLSAPVSMDRSCDDLDVTVTHQQHTGCVHGINLASRTLCVKPYDIIVVISDDIMPAYNWDTYLHAELAKRDNIGEKPVLLVVKNGRQDDLQLAQMPVLNGKAFEELERQIYNPSYQHLCGDVELFERARDAGWLHDVRQSGDGHPVFAHQHPDTGEREADQVDETNKSNWQKDWDTLEARRKACWPRTADKMLDVILRYDNGRCGDTIFMNTIAGALRSTFRSVEVRFQMLGYETGTMYADYCRIYDGNAATLLNTALPTAHRVIDCTIFPRRMDEWQASKLPQWKFLCMRTHDSIAHATQMGQVEPLLTTPSRKTLRDIRKQYRMPPQYNLCVPRSISAFGEMPTAREVIQYAQLMFRTSKIPLYIMDGNPHVMEETTGARPLTLNEAWEMVPVISGARNILTVNTSASIIATALCHPRTTHIINNSLGDWNPSTHKHERRITPAELREALKGGAV